MFTDSSISHFKLTFLRVNSIFLSILSSFSPLLALRYLIKLGDFIIPMLRYRYLQLSLKEIVAALNLFASLA